MSIENRDFEVRDLRASVEDTPILKGLNLTIGAGEVHAVMGPNGSGKSTLANVIMGHPSYTVTGGDVRYKDRNLLELDPDERARLGIFLAFQYPVGIPGVTVANFLKTAHDAVHGREGTSASAFIKTLRENMAYLEMDPAVINRAINDGFSGGEKKRMEILQMLTLRPEFAVLDETDSGLDIDALRVVAKGIQRLSGPHFGMLVITHYERFLNYLDPDHLHIMIDGRIVVSGGPELVKELEEKGYDWVREKHVDAALATA